VAYLLIVGGLDLISTFGSLPLGGGGGGGDWVLGFVMAKKLSNKKKQKSTPVKTHQPPVKLDMPFDEVIKRMVRVKPVKTKSVGDG
jgi:hypothetical protein